VAGMQVNSRIHPLMSLIRLGEFADRPPNTWVNPPIHLTAAGVNSRIHLSCGVVGRLPSACLLSPLAGLRADVAVEPAWGARAGGLACGLALLVLAAAAACGSGGLSTDGPLGTNAIEAEVFSP
jgi:hypothetical protein